MPSTTTGDEYLHALSNFIHLHEVRLSEIVGRRRRQHDSSNDSLLGAVSTLWNAPASWVGLGGGDQAGTGSSSSGGKPLILRLTPHHLYYLLLRFEEFQGIPSSSLGALDVKTDKLSKPNSALFLDVAGGARGGGGESGVNKMGQRTDGHEADVETKSTFSVISNFSLGSTWWGGSESKPSPSPEQDVKYLYSTFTKLPALQINPMSLSPINRPPPTHLPPHSSHAISSHPELPGDNAVPLYVFKSLGILVLEDLDPNAFTGWDVLSENLRSLTVKGGLAGNGEPDLEGWLVGKVLGDERRRKDRLRLAEEAAREGMDDGTGDGYAERGNVGQTTVSSSAGVAEVSSSDTRTESQSSSRTIQVGGFSMVRSRDSDEPSILILCPSKNHGKDSSEHRFIRLPEHKWWFLRHLSLPNNDLTFIPMPAFEPLAHLISLDLSSNLLISVPPALTHLTSLQSLNLANNMIDTVLGIWKILGNVTVINLSGNRLDSLCGLERLYALERIDLRRNNIFESAEVGRLAPLPAIREVWVDGNSFTDYAHGELDWRIKSFNYFAKEGNMGVEIDGTGPSLMERRSIIESPKPSISSRNGAKGGLRNPLPEVRPVKPRSPDLRPRDSLLETERPDASTPIGPSSETGYFDVQRSANLPRSQSFRPSRPLSVGRMPTSASLQSIATVDAEPVSLRQGAVKQQRRRPRRIVDLDEGGAPPITSRLVTNGAGSTKAGSQPKVDSGTDGSGMSDSDTAPGSRTPVTGAVGESRSGANNSKRSSLAKELELTAERRKDVEQQQTSSSSSDKRPTEGESSRGPTTAWTGHARHSTALDPERTWDSSVDPEQRYEDRWYTTNTLGRRSTRRKDRRQMNASMFDSKPDPDAEVPGASSTGSGSGGAEQETSGEELRKRMEQLRTEVGSNWLRVLSHQPDTAAALKEKITPAIAGSGKGTSPSVHVEARPRAEGSQLEVVTPVVKVVKKKRAGR